MIMHNVLNNDARQKIIFAILGMTKSGKTTGIAALTNCPESIIELSHGDDGRTKVTVEYHFINKTVVGGIKVEAIDFHEQTILKSPDGLSKDVYNAEVKKNPIYKNILKLREAAADEPLKDCVISQLSDLKNKISTLEEIKTLISTEKIDLYVRKVILCVQKNTILQAHLSNIDLYIRDTRGLMDIALEKDDEDGKKLANVRPLSEIGLDGIHGVIFFSSDNYPNIVSSIYRDTIETVFRSVPFFLIARDKALTKLFRLNEQPETLENIKAFIDSIQCGEAKYYPDVEAEFFEDTLRLLNDFKVTEHYSDGSYKFIDPYFKQPETEFLVSSVTALRRPQNAKDVIIHRDFMFFQLTVTASFCKIVGMVTNLLNDMKRILRSGTAGDILMSQFPDFSIRLSNDLQRYNIYHTSYDASEIVKPQLTYLTEAQLGIDLADPGYTILGTYGGITTLSSGRLRHASTAILCVTARKSLMELIANIKISSDLSDTNGDAIIVNLKGDFGKQEALLKIALRYVLFQLFTDVNASIQKYLIVNRYKAKASIECIRNRSTPPANAVIESVRSVVAEFCATLQNFDNIESLFSIRRD